MGLGRAGDASVQMPLPWPREAQCPPPYPVPSSQMCPPSLPSLPCRHRSPSFWGLLFFTQSDTWRKESKKKSPSFWLMTWGVVWREAQVEGFWGAPS